MIISRIYQVKYSRKRKQKIPDNSQQYQVLTCENPCCSLQEVQLTCNTLIRKYINCPMCGAILKKVGYILAQHKIEKEKENDTD